MSTNKREIWFSNDNYKTYGQLINFIEFLKVDLHNTFGENSSVNERLTSITDAEEKRVFLTTEKGINFVTKRLVVTRKRVKLNYHVNCSLIYYHNLSDGRFV